MGGARGACRARLADRRRRSPAFHDLQREFLLLETESVALLHADLLAAYRALLPEPSAAWSRLPREEPYIWDQLPYHLAGAGERAEMVSVCTDLVFVPRWGLRPASRMLLRVLAGHGAPVVALAFSPDGRRLAGGDDGTVRLWDPDSGAELARGEGHISVHPLAFSPDGRRLAGGSGDWTVRLWDPGSGAGSARDERRGGLTWALAFSADGRRLASGGDDGTMRLWDPDSGGEFARSEGRVLTVRALACSLD